MPGRHDFGTGSSVVYILQWRERPVGEWNIKIGTTDNYRDRIRDHRAGKPPATPPEIRELAVVSANGGVERDLHNFWRPLSTANGRKNWEHFAPDDDMLAWIRWLRDQWWVYVPRGEALWRTVVTQKDGTEKIVEHPYDGPEMNPDSLETVPYEFWTPRDTSRRRGAPLQETADGLPFLSFGTAPNDPFDIPARVIMGDDFYTPKKVIEAAREAMGGIDLDPASHAVANRVVKAKRIISCPARGQDAVWEGRIWLNPPFSEWKSFGDALIREIRAGRVSEACALAANRTQGSQHFFHVMEAAVAACTTNGRLKFWGPRAGSSDDGHTIYYFGPHRDRFRRAFAGVGKVWFTPERVVPA